MAMGFTMGPNFAFAFDVFGTILVSFVVLAFVIYLWGLVLDKYEHDPGRVRALMFLILAFVTSVEMSLCARGITHQWVAYLSLVTNLWGGLDALLRYPAAHSLDSFFTAKQLLLLTAKTIGYAFGMRIFRIHAGVFFMELLLNIWGLMVLYLMALPLNEREQVARDSDYDVDLMIRVWQLATVSHERRRCVATCRTWWYRRLTAASECSPLARYAICAASPEYRRTFKKRGRSV
jgi:hypothetical protein